jgi:DNA-binding MarR family transcriptional regulator
MRTFFAAVRRARGRGVAGSNDELTLSRLHVLLALREEGEQRVGALAEAAGLAAPTVTRMLDSLEEEGVVVRRHSEEDRRCVTATLTERGIELVDRKRQDVDEKLGKVFDSLDESDRGQAERLLSSLAAAVGEL